MNAVLFVKEYFRLNVSYFTEKSIVVLHVVYIRNIAQRNSAPHSAGDYVNSLLGLNSAHPSYCTVTDEHSSEVKMHV